MRTEKLNKLMNEGFKARLYIENKGLKCYLYSDDTNTVHPVYYNHVKKHLNKHQLELIETFNKVKNYTFRDDVDINIKYNSGKETREEIATRVVRKAIIKGERLEQD